MNLAMNISNAELTENLRVLSIRERKITTEVIVHIAEFMRRKLYLDHGCTSIFGYLTTKLLYAGSTAQNRIDAAKLLIDAPELEKELTSGAINLAQVSILARGLGQASFEKTNLTHEKSEPETRELIDHLKNCDARESAIIVAKALDLNLKPLERQRYQKDESVVLEVTLSKHQMDALRKAKDLASHVLPVANWAEIISFLTEEYLKRKDLSRESARPAFRKAAPAYANSQCSSAENRTEDTLGKPARKALPKSTLRQILQRDRVCQQVDTATGEICESTYQLQVDHLVSVSKGGGNEIENLQVLCGIHNRLKYQRHG